MCMRICGSWIELLSVWQSCEQVPKRSCHRVRDRAHIQGFKKSKVSLNMQMHIMQEHFTVCIELSDQVADWRGLMLMLQEVPGQCLHATRIPFKGNRESSLVAVNWYKMFSSD